MTDFPAFVDDFFAEGMELPSEIARRHRVDVALVTHDGVRWLPRTLAALRSSTVQPDSVNVIDTGSVDGTLEILANAGAMLRTVMTAPRDQAFGSSLARVISTLPDVAVGGAEASQDGIETYDDAWIWVIHDDSAPAPEALAALLRASELHPDAGILGCKSVGWNDSSKLQDVGITLTGSGHRDPRVEHGERDQGQYVETEEVLAVSSAGMLIRRDVWQTLQGMRAIFAFYRDDIDFCWRAWEHGYRVRVVPQAEMAHREAATHDVRSQDVRRGSAHRIGREVSLATAYIHAPALARPFTLLRLVLASLLRALVYFVGKDPRDSGDELRALFAFVTNPMLLLREIESRGVIPVRAPRCLRPSIAEQMWHGVDLVATVAVEKLDDLLEVWAGSDVFDVVEVVDDAEDAAEAQSEEPIVLTRSRRQSFLRHVWRRPGTLLFVGLLIIGVLGTRNTWGSGVLQGGSLLPADGGAGDLFRAYFSDWHRVGLGSNAPTPAWMPLLAMWSWLFGGNVSAAVGALLVLGVPLAGLSAHLAARPLMPQAEPRAFFAATYALLPGLLIAVSSGRLGSIVLAIALPMLLRLAWRCDESWQRAAAMALAVAFTAAWVPVAWVFFVVWASISGLFWRRLRIQRVRLAFMAVSAWLVLFPLSLEWIAQPSSLLRGTGADVPNAADQTFFHVLLLQPGGAASPWLYSTAGLLLAAMGALVQKRRTRRIVLGWTVAVTMFGSYVLLTVLTAWWKVDDPSTGSTLQRWAGPFTIALGLALLLVIASVTDGLAESLSRATFSWRQVVTIALTFGVLLAPVLSAGSWLWRNGDSPVRRTEVSAIPAFVLAKTSMPMSIRVLSLHRDSAGIVRFSVYDGHDATIGDADVARNVANSDLKTIVGSMLSGRDRTDAQRLAAMGIMYVTVGDGDPAMIQALDGAVGLRRLAGGTRGSTSTWEVQAPNQRFALTWFESAQPVVDPLDYTVGQTLSGSTQLDAAGSNRIVSIAEPAGAWLASLDGKPLAPAASYSTSWRQAWKIPSGAHGQLTVEYQHGQRLGALTFALLALIGLLLLALPSYRPFTDADAEVMAP